MFDLVNCFWLDAGKELAGGTLLSGNGECLNIFCLIVTGLAIFLLLLVYVGKGLCVSFPEFRILPSLTIYSEGNLVWVIGVSDY